MSDSRTRFASIDEELAALGSSDLERVAHLIRSRAKLDVIDDELVALETWSGQRPPLVADELFSDAHETNAGVIPIELGPNFLPPVPPDAHLDEPATGIFLPGTVQLDHLASVPDDAPATLASTLEGATKILFEDETLTANDDPASARAVQEISEDDAPMLVTELDDSADVELFLSEIEADDPDSEFASTQRREVGPMAVEMSDAVPTEAAPPDAIQPAAAPAPETPKEPEEKPGFFGKLFGRKKK